MADLAALAGALETLFCLEVLVYIDLGRISGERVGQPQGSVKRNHPARAVEFA